uniref:Uncharacterized protein n=1 Tax=Anopheles minimus TaxID=112268 RepID=A0A182WIG1_9DIPT
MRLTYPSLLRMLLVLDVLKRNAAIRLTCFSMFCNVIDFTSNEDTFVYQYIPTNTSMVVLQNVLIEHLEMQMLTKLPPIVTVQSSLALKWISVPMDVNDLRITSTSLTKINFDERSMLSRLTVKESKLAKLPRTLGNARSLEFVSVTESNVRHLDLAAFCDYSLLQIIGTEWDFLPSQEKGSFGF